MNRTQARAAAMQLAYEWEMGGDGGEDTRRGLLEIQPGEDESEYMQMLFEGVRDNRERLDREIGQFTREWSVDRLSRVDISILRVAAYEMELAQQPGGVVIEQAVQLSRKYSDDKAGAFINGVLGAMSRARKA
jgi:N utilization substance protein B